MELGARSLFSFQLSIGANSHETQAQVRELPVECEHECLCLLCDWMIISVLSGWPYASTLPLSRRHSGAIGPFFFALALLTVRNPMAGGQRIIGLQSGPKASEWSLIYAVAQLCYFM